MQGQSLEHRYTLLERIEEGSYGTVYKAKNSSTGQIVAVKVFKGNPKLGLPVSFVRQKYIYDVLPTQYLPELLQNCQYQQQPAMVLQWLDTDLRSAVVAGRKMDVRGIFYGILEGVGAFHAQGFMHRDLKPGNIMLGARKQGEVSADMITLDDYCLRIIDLGMAKEWQEGEEMTNMVGSLCYRAPQLLLGATRYDSSIDIWALGCIFYCISVGKTLFRGDGELEQLVAIVNKLGLKREEVEDECVRQRLQSWGIEDRQPVWSAEEGGLSEVQWDFLRQMVAFDPRKRASCSELLQHAYFQ